uniref:Uncharacterized protein n=1 Tax=Clandestinovirus TaxID=2831644 RepID=A0A8F8KQN1_9VIRU|nr:hypothetical protein KOM_12_139 [Clandestinovirus]
MQVPNDVFRVIMKKVDGQMQYIKKQTFIKCIIPYVYLEERQKESDGPAYGPDAIECANVLGSVYSKNQYMFVYHTTFTLTSLKRVCKIFADEVNLGAWGSSYEVMKYRKAKNKW